MMRSWYRALERYFEIDDGLMWHMDLKPHASGDFSMAVVQANLNLEDQSQVFTSPSATYVGVYDGHGGPEAARFVSWHLFPYLDKFQEEQGGLSAEVIRRAFNATEEDFIRFVKQCWPLKPRLASVGSCCLVGAISGSELYVANLGDSRAVLGRRDSVGVVAERLSTDHNVSCERVREEVQLLHPDDPSIVVKPHGVWRVKGIMQVSRSIGDAYLKRPEINWDGALPQHQALFPLKRAVVTAEPSVLIRNIEPHDLFLIFASNGLWEHLTDEEAVEIVFKNPRAGIAKKLVEAAIQETAKKMNMRCKDVSKIGKGLRRVLKMRYKDVSKIEKGIRRYFHDDITVIVIYLDHKKHSFQSEGAVDCIAAPVQISSDHSSGVASEPSS